MKEFPCLTPGCKLNLVESLRSNLSVLLPTMDSLWRVSQQKDGNADEEKNDSEEDECSLADQVASYRNAFQIYTFFLIHIVLNEESKSTSINITKCNCMFECVFLLVMEYRNLACIVDTKNDQRYQRIASKNSSVSTKNARRPMADIKRNLEAILKQSEESPKNQQSQVYKPVPHQNQTSQEQQKGIDSMLPTPQPDSSVPIPTPMLPLMFIRTIKSRMPTISKVLTQCFQPLNPMAVLLSPFPVLPQKYFITSKARMPTISKEKITNFQKGESKGGGSSNMDDSRIDLRAPATTTYEAPMIQGNINNRINMTTQNDTQNLSPILIEDIDPDAKDSLDYESMEGSELGHSDDEGKVNSGRVEVNALVQQEKENPVYKEADSRGHFQAATQTMSQVQQQQNVM
ncbi:hypothetical protein KY289_001130 [Solanum tuberosum]|nr:hypothetical protein KY289_001130 [Solanum tuberosum]